MYDYYQLIRQSGNTSALHPSEQKEYVRLLQEKLSELGYFKERADGIFGIDTRNAITILQHEHGLTPNGIVTRDVLDVILSAGSEYFPILKEGSVSKEVMTLQTLLRTTGFFLGTATGKFEYETTVAVESFQRANDLPPTGIVDSKTWNILNKKAKVGVSKETPLPVLERPTLRHGDEGEYVRELQRELKQQMFYDGEIDGKFGDKTLRSVKAFQANKRLTVDGVVGRETWNALTQTYVPNTTLEGGLYAVQPGDTLWAIAKRYDTTVSELMKLNDLTSNLLSIGQELVVPGIPGIVSALSTIPYTVKRGDSLWSIAKKYGTTVNAIKKTNGLVGDTLSVGQQLIITNSALRNDLITYTVQRGDNLWSIASKFGTTVDEIKAINGLTGNLLNIGQELKIPR